MGNPAKAKGDRAELDAVRMLLELCPDLCLPKSQRKLGAGRAEDVGDLHVFPDVAIQVRNYKLDKLGSAIRSSAKDGVIQAANGDVPFGLGLVPYPNARLGTVKWIAAAESWPVELPVEPIPFALVSKAMTWLRDDNGPHGFMAYPRLHRIGVLAGGVTAPVLFAPIEAWIAAYRDALASASGDVLPFSRGVLAAVPDSQPRSIPDFHFDDDGLDDRAALAD